MEINLALNTIIYLMIFIVPGLLFRNFFYRKEFSREFYFGNLFERFIWTLLFSILMLITCYFLVLISLSVGVDLAPEISYDTIKDIYNNIHNVQNDVPFPNKENFSQKSKDFFLLIFILYGLSVLLGFICNKLALVFNFNFYNYWHALFKGKLNKAPNRDLRYLHTEIDILTHDKVIYTGKIKNYYLSKNDTNIETIVLENTYKKEQGKNFTAILGHNFCIDKEAILNMNLSYVYEETNRGEYRKSLSKLLKYIGIGLYFLLIFFFVYIIMSNQLPFLRTLADKVLFFFSIFMISVPIAEGFLTLTFPKKENTVSFMFFGLLAFWIYIGVSFWWFFPTLFILVTLYIFIHRISAKKHDNKEGEQQEKTDES